MKSQLRNLGKWTCWGAPLAALAFTASCGGQEAQVFEHQGLRLEVRIAPDPPVAGENVLAVRVLDEAGAPLEGARLSARATMPAMGAMPAMESGTAIGEKGSGRYEISFVLSMNGAWDIPLSIERQGRAPVIFLLQISPPRPGIAHLSDEAPAGQAGHVHGASGGASGEAGAAGVTVSEGRRQLIGLKTAPVRKETLARTIRTVGRVEVDERRLKDVTLKFSGWIEKLEVGYEGSYVRQGDPLFSIYSQELYVSEQEFLDALRSKASPGLVESARERLRLWDLGPAQVEELVRTGRADKRTVIRSPATGYVVAKTAVEGMRVEPGMRLYQIADLSTVWVIASVYEFEAGLVRAGQDAWVSAPYSSQAALRGKVDYLYPRLDAVSRTLPVRVVFENQGMALRPGMFVDVAIGIPLGEQLSIPESAVLFSGEHRYTFVDQGEGRLEPREILLGPKADASYSVLAGLSEGEVVVSSATFLISSEAKLRSALPRWGEVKALPGLPAKEPVVRTPEAQRGAPGSAPAAPHRHKGGGQ